MSRMSPSNFSIASLTRSFFRSSPMSARRVSTSSTINSLPISLNLSFFSLSTFCGCIGIRMSLLQKDVQYQKLENFQYFAWQLSIYTGISVGRFQVKAYKMMHCLEYLHLRL